MELEELKSSRVVISCAMTGTSTPRAKNGNLPVTPEEIARDAIAAWRAGAAVVHLHMRDENENGVMDWTRFERTIRLIRADHECDVIINCTSSGGPGLDGTRSTQSRLEHFQKIPDIEMGSFDAGTFNWGDAKEFNNDPAFLKELAKTYLDCGVKPEVEIFDMGMLGNAAHYFQKLKLLQAPLWCQFMMATIAMGGHLRVGLEDTLYLDRGVPATNGGRVERAATLIRLYNKRPATPAEARRIMGIPPLKAR